MSATRSRAQPARAHLALDAGDGVMVEATLPAMQRPFLGGHSKRPYRQNLRCAVQIRGPIKLFRWLAHLQRST
jgi:hypothetical protein